MSVSTSSCHETFSVHTSFLKDTFSSESVRAPMRSKSQTSAEGDEGKEDNEDMRTDEGETEVESEVEVEIEEGGDRFYPSSVAQSGSKWPAISITFHREIALTRATLAEQSTQTSLSAIRPQGVWGRQIYPQTCWLEIWSNKSTHRFPLHIIDGGVRLAYADAVRALIVHFIEIFIDCLLILSLYIICSQLSHLSSTFHISPLIFLSHLLFSASLLHSIIIASRLPPPYLFSLPFSHPLSLTLLGSSFFYFSSYTLSYIKNIFSSSSSNSSILSFLLTLG